MKFPLSNFYAQKVFKRATAVFYSDPYHHHHSSCQRNHIQEMAKKTSKHHSLLNNKLGSTK